MKETWDILRFLLIEALLLQIRKQIEAEMVLVLHMNSNLQQRLYLGILRIKCNNKTQKYTKPIQQDIHTFIVR
jgi:hypothetical protein